MRSGSLLFGSGVAGLFGASILLISCTKATPDYCEKDSDCVGGKICSVVHFACIFPDAALGPVDVAGEGVDVPSGLEIGDFAVGAPGDAAAGVDVGMDAASPDVYVPDAWFCTVGSQCTDPSKAFCVGGACMGCTTDQQCRAKDPAQGACRGDGRCVQCTGNSSCSGAMPVCDVKTNICVQCLSAASCSGLTPICAASEKCAACATDAECAALGDVARFACAASGACVQCTATNTTKCSGVTPVCSAKLNTCVQCTSAANCSGVTPICGADDKCQACTEAGCAALNDPLRYACAATGGCVQCTSANAAKCTGATPVCDGKLNTCVECISAANCSGSTPICGTNDKCQACAGETDCASLGDPLRFACAASGSCVQCTAANSAKCTGSTPACDTTTNTCVQCTASSYCSGTAPICGTNETCQACTGDSDCGSLSDPSRAACATSGACVQCTSANATACSGSTSVCNTATSRCVQCLTNATCSGNAPICNTSTSTCRKCSGTSDCAGFPGQTACAASGACVQCTDNSTCSGTTPICNTGSNTCRSCTADSECSAIGPGLCMADGHCATSSETVYVGTSGGATCSESNTGTASAPVCSLQVGVSLAKSGSKPAIVIRGTLAAGSTSISVSSPLTIVGKNTAKITPTSGGDGITITAGEVYLRSLTIQGTPSPATGMGINATTGVTLHMDTCTVINNPGGGILLNGAAFDIENTTVTGSGPGATGGGTLWGGIRVDALPASGSTKLNLATVQNNSPTGISCAGNISGTHVLATGNNGSTNPAYQIVGCGFTSCTAGPGCGAP